MKKDYLYNEIIMIFSVFFFVLIVCFFRSLKRQLGQPMSMVYFYFLVKKATTNKLPKFTSTILSTVSFNSNNLYLPHKCGNVFFLLIKQQHQIEEVYPSLYPILMKNGSVW